MIDKLYTVSVVIHVCMDDGARTQIMAGRPAYTCFLGEKLLANPQSSAETVLRASLRAETV